jgi:OmpA-OmpF porin, OOP family
MRALAIAIVLSVAVPLSAAAAPAPQYTPQQLENDFSKPAAAPSDDCAAAGMATGPDGECEPSKGATRGFSLIAPEANSPSSGRAAANGMAPRGPARPSHGRAVASKGSMPRASAAAPVGRDLLINFANGSTVLTEQARANAKAFAEALNSPALHDVRFAIDGHTNAVGSRDSNLKLSRARAQALVDFLVTQGVDASRLDANGYGFDRPIDGARPSSPANRRVEAHRLN